MWLFAVKKYEGFAKGSNPRYWNERMENGYSKRWSTGEEMMPGELYRDTAGEIEARDAASRRTLTPKERINKAPDLGDENAVFAEDGVSYSINNTRDMTISEQLKEYRAGRLTSHDEFYYGSAPTVLNTAGLNGQPLVMSQTDFKKAKSEKHNVPTRAMTRLTESLSDPILPFGAGDKVGILTKDIDGDGKPLLVAISKNVDLDGETVNRIKSAYGLDNPQAWIKNQLSEGKELRIFDNKKADSFLDEFGYLAERPKNYRLGDIVTGIHEKVKSPSQQSVNKQFSVSERTPEQKIITYVTAYETTAAAKKRGNQKARFN